MESATIPCKSFLHPRTTVVEAAASAAAAANLALASHDRVVLDFAGVRGVSSSYFNVVFGTLVKSLGVDGLKARVNPVYDSDGQRRIAEISLQAVIADVGGQKSTA